VQVEQKSRSGAQPEARWVYVQSTEGFHLDVLNLLTENLAVNAGS
jgi:hypothetical protein